jgi:uncharacterized membrane protein YjjP (DUF1212 family)
MRPTIGSDPRCLDSRLWRFERTSGLSRDAFAEPHRGDRWVLIVAVGILAGVVATLVGGWL